MKLSSLIAVLEVIKGAQAQNGLRHNDFERYRQYCTRRLHRIRQSKTVKQAGTGASTKQKKFTKKDIVPELVTDVRSLHIPLMCAERCWAEAMAMKQEEEGTATSKGRNRFLNKLKKAVHYSKELVDLCLKRADQRTCLEAEAHLAFLKGALWLESEEWQTSLESFVASSQIYSQLGANVITRRSKELYLARVEEIAPNERYCKYNLHRSNPGASNSNTSSSSTQRVSQSSSLLDKIQAAASSLHEQSITTIATDFTSVFWRRSILRLKHDATRVCLRSATLKAAQLWEASAATSAASNTSLSSLLRLSDPFGTSSAVDGPNSSQQELKLDGNETLYLEVLSKFKEAAKQAKAEADRAVKEGREADAGDARALLGYLHFLQQRVVLDRTEALLVNSVLRCALAGRTGESGTAPTASTSASSGQSSKVPNLFSLEPMCAALQRSSTGSTSSSAENTALAAAASKTAALIARAIKTIDDMLALVGEGEGDPEIAEFVAATAELPSDTDLQAALHARKAFFNALRSWFVAMSYFQMHKELETEALLLRAKKRVSEAQSLYRTLSEGVTLLRGDKKVSVSLPISSISASDFAAKNVTYEIVMSGINSTESSILSELANLVEGAAVKMRASTLLSSTLSSSTSSYLLDEKVQEVYSTIVSDVAAFTSSQKQAQSKPGRGLAAPPLSLKLSSKGVPLTVRSLQESGVFPATSPSSILPWPPANVPTPFKPLVYDLAFNGVLYSDFSKHLPAKPAAGSQEKKEESAAASSSFFNRLFK
jgi:RNA-binding signal recognition particle 68